MKRPPRRKNNRGQSPPEQQPIGSAAPAAAGSRRRLVWLLSCGIILVCVAALIRYRAESNPMLRIPPVETKDVLPTVAKEIRLRQEAIMADPTSPEAWGTYGLVLLAHDFRDQAATCFAEAEQLDDTDYRWPYYFGMTMGTKDTEKSLQAFRRAVRKGPERVTIRLRLAEWLFDLRQLDQCEQQTRKALELEPENPRAQLLIARLLFQEGKTKESLAWAERAAHSPKGDRRDVYELLARLYMRLGDADAANEAVERAERLPRGVAVWDDPEMGLGGTMVRDASILSTLATIHLARGNREQWLNLLRQVVEREPDNVHAKEKLANGLVESKRYDEAAKFIDQTLKEYPDFSEFECLRGQIDMARGAPGAARKRFTRAVRLKRDYADAFMWLGRASAALDQKSEAVAALREAVRLSPSLANAYDDLASVLLASGRASEAVESARRAAALKPGDYAIALRLAQTLAATNRPEEARQILNSLILSAEDPSEAKKMLEQLTPSGTDDAVSDEPKRESLK